MTFDERVVVHRVDRPCFGGTGNLARMAYPHGVPRATSHTVEHEGFDFRAFGIEGEDTQGLSIDEIRVRIVGAQVLRVVHLGRSTCHAISGQGS